MAVGSQCERWSVVPVPATGRVATNAMSTSNDRTAVVALANSSTPKYCHNRCAQSGGAITVHIGDHGTSTADSSAIESTPSWPVLLAPSMQDSMTLQVVLKLMVALGCATALRVAGRPGTRPACAPVSMSFTFKVQHCS